MIREGEKRGGNGEKREGERKGRERGEGREDLPLSHT